MPCPYFEPQRVADNPWRVTARLPLLDEYDGLCHADGALMAAPAELRFGCCNHGYSRGTCGRFPADEERSGLRYHLVKQTSATLEVLYIEERQYTPLRWQPVRYFMEGERMEPEIADLCVRAQLLAFCRSYLKRYVDQRS